jgi:hypothetical protein
MAVVAAERAAASDNGTMTPSLRLGTLALAAVLTSAAIAGPAAAAPTPETPGSTSSPTPSPGGRAGRATNPGYILVLALLGAALLWQVQRGRRSSRAYSHLATSEFERRLEPDERTDVREE